MPWRITYFEKNFPQTIVVSWRGAVTDQGSMVSDKVGGMPSGTHYGST